MQTIRRLINANSMDGVLFDLYKQQALLWHSQFGPVDANRLAVVWSDGLGLEIVPRMTKAASAPA
jgi:hypothetical protein